MQFLQLKAVSPPLSPAIPSYTTAPVPICFPKPAWTAYIPSLRQRSSFPHSALVRSMFRTESIFGQAGSWLWRSRGLSTLNTCTLQCFKGLWLGWMGQTCLIWQKSDPWHKSQFRSCSKSQGLHAPCPFPFVYKQKTWQHTLSYPLSQKMPCFFLRAPPFPVFSQRNLAWGKMTSTSIAVQTGQVSKKVGNQEKTTRPGSTEHEAEFYNIRMLQPFST